MDMKSYIDEIKLKLGGNVLGLELDDSAFEMIVNSALREIQYYIDSTRLATLPFKSCIDLSDCKVSSVSAVFRAKGYVNSNSGSTRMDPMQASYWQLLSGIGSNIYSGLNDFTYRYASYNTLMQVRNTLSTDLAFRYDRHSNYLYINTSGDKPQYITIEYVPRYDSVDEVVSDYWIDMILQLSVALAKVSIGRIRSRFTQSNALWTQDGEQMLTEGNEELNKIRDYLKANHQLTYPID